MSHLPFSLHPSFGAEPRLAALTSDRYAVSDGVVSDTQGTTNHITRYSHLYPRAAGPVSPVKPARRAE